MTHEIVTNTYTASIEVFNLSPTPEEFLRMHHGNILKAIADGGFKIDWKGPAKVTGGEGV